MTVCNVNNVEKLFNVPDGCRGAASITLPDGSRYDWNKNGRFIKSLIRGLDISSIRKICLDLDEPSDLYKMAMHAIHLRH